MTTGGELVARIAAPRAPADTDESPATIDATRLFQEHAADLLRYLARRAGADTAEDLTADVFEAVLAGKAKFNASRGSERAWLFGIATNLLRHHLRGRGRERRALVRQAATQQVAPVADVTARLDARRTVAQLQAALSDLRPDDRDLLLLVAWAELTPSEAATALGIPAGTARSRLHRVRTHLRDALPAGCDDVKGV